MPPWIRRFRPAEFCEGLLLAVDLDPDDFQLGFTRVFFRTGALASCFNSRALGGGVVVW